VLVSCNSCFITLPTSLEVVWIYIYQRNLLSNEVKSNAIMQSIILLYAIYPLSFENVFNLQVIVVTKWLRFSEMCCVLTIFPYK
jgi:hypothetical protein